MASDAVQVLIPEHQGDEDLILQERLANRQAKGDRERAVVLRVYNYFRIVLSFFLIILFYEVPDQAFVGRLEPGLFQTVILFYLMFNVATGFIVLVSHSERFRGATAASTYTVFDIFFLTVLLFTSGGVDSGLGYLLVFSVAFGSVMIGGQMSFLFPALATVNGISSEIYLHNIGAVVGSQHFFEMAMLGTSFFVVNYFFQYASEKLSERELEVVNLQTLDRLHRIAEKSRQELEISNARFSVLLTSTGEGVLGLDMEGIITFANPRACELLDIDYLELIDTDVQRFMIAERKTADDSPQKILDLLGIRARFPYDASRWQTASEKSFIVEYSCEATVNKENNRTGAVLLFRNITQVRENEEKVQYLANYDELTGLANRTNFHEVLKSALSLYSWSNRTIGILVVDTDHFSVLNEKEGEEAGDEILRVIARRLKETVREGGLVARLHGDQFALMLVDLDQAEDVVPVAESVIREVAKPMEIYGKELSTSVSVGIAVLGETSSNANDLISAAISAVDNAKQEGRNTYRFYNPDMQAKAEEKKRVQILLRNATAKNEFKMMYQPIVSLKENNIASFEALIRWYPENEEPIRPDIFIPIAEESGQINNIGSWVLSSVAEQLKQWKTQFGEFPAVAVNISSKQLRDSVFREQYADMLKQFDLPVDVVELELTETGMMEDPEKCLEELGHLHEMGVKLSIDDFGTGYSSLDYLRRLPMDLLKIDQSFTRGLGESGQDEEFVRVMIQMAHAMGLQVICEGVETREQMDFLNLHGCDLAQGYFFSKPKTVEDVTDLYTAVKNGTIALMEGEAG
ncbi:MAG: diguanylate cyclase (GGDEF)-like protein [Candidatus Azotimanducaceae bacterium]|jgi:diguanylate cyclase (GGDEF)-like protein